MPTNCTTFVYQLLNKPISQHAWNSDKSSKHLICKNNQVFLELAICPNSEEIVLLKKEGSEWIVEDILKEVNNKFGSCENNFIFPFSTIK